MREIKFRIPLKHGYAYMTLEDISTGEYCTENWEWNKAEQYIGLKDKTGKEIYEGDIVYVHELISKIIIGDVLRVNQETKEHGLCYFGINESRNSIIIGNIYENPELFGG